MPAETVVPVNIAVEPIVSVPIVPDVAVPEMKHNKLGYQSVSSVTKPIKALLIMIVLNAPDNE